MVGLLLHAACGEDGDATHKDPVTSGRVVMWAGSKRTLCTFWEWKYVKEVFQVRDQWIVPGQDPHKCLGGGAGGTGLFETTAAERIKDRAALEITLPSRLFIAGGVGESASEFSNNQAYLYDGPADSWRGMSMSVARSGHTVTPLLDGGALIVGGREGGGTFDSLASVERFDPLAVAITTTGSLNTPRMNHAAALLADGRVLVTGGSHDTTPFASAEIYDPATGLFAPTADMAFVRTFHMAVTLEDGRVLIAGSNAIKPCELFDSQTETFLPAGNMNVEHGYGATATLLESGKVLVAGGLDSSQGVFSTAAAELFDPATGQFTRIADMNFARRTHVAVLQGDGQVLIAGGIIDNGDTVETTELFDPATNTFTPGPDQPLPASEQAAVLIAGLEESP